MGNGLVLRKENTGEEISDQQMPSYYIDQPHITPRDIQNVRESWDMILCERKASHKQAKVHGECQSHSRFTRFYESFFFQLQYLFVTTSDHAFANNNFLVNIILCMISRHSAESPTFQLLLQSLLANMDVCRLTFHDMSVIGGILFTTLQECLGKTFTAVVRDSWVKLYSAVLSDIVTQIHLNSESTGRTSLCSTNDI